MIGARRVYALVAALVSVCGLLVFAGLFGPGAYRLITTPAVAPPDFVATLQVLAERATAMATIPTATSSNLASAPAGHIVLTCQVYKVQASEQICMMNSDGSGYRRLTTEDGVRHFYPSLAPDGKSVVYSQYRTNNVYEIYELSLGDATARRLTDDLGVLTAPEISPDGSLIAFMRWTPASEQYQIWVMDRDGGNPRRVFAGTGWDPTWSPDGGRLLFASDRDGLTQLFTVDLDGTGLQRISNLPSIRGRSDWSPLGLIATYSGESWHREIYVMSANGSNARQVSPPGGNSQGPSFSPDGQWIVFTGYFDRLNDIHGCEIYSMRIDRTALTRLTNNDYCDYQPRWGP
jgi:TolB protein